MLRSIPSALCLLGCLSGRTLAVRDTRSRQADIRSIAGSSSLADGALLRKVPGYDVFKKASCRARTMDEGRMEGDEPEEIVEECRRACEWKPACECFEIVGSRCRISISKGRKTKKGGRGAAYVRDPTYVDPEEVCKSGEYQKVRGSCSEYLVCDRGEYERYECPEGLAFDAKSGKCTWPTAVPSCTSLAEHELTPLDCQSKFLLARGDTPAMQQWIKIEMDRWWGKVTSIPDVYSRAEGRAATSILRTASIEITAKVKPGENVTTSRWALFSRDENGTLHMQSVALVEQAVSAVNVMAIVSRRSLLNDKVCARSAGRALLSGVLRTVHDEHPNRDLTLLGTPGDAYVEKMYRSHGMKEYGREETGMPKLKVSYAPKCVQFITETILCKEMDWNDVGSIAWRLVPGSWYVRETCAHLIPAMEYWRQILRTAGLRI